MNKTNLSIKCNKNDIINFNGEKFKCLKEFELPKIATKSYLLDLWAKGILEMII